SSSFTPKCRRIGNERVGRRPVNGVDAHPRRAWHYQTRPRAARGRDPTSAPARRAAVIGRLERHPRSTIPAQALLSSAGCVSQLAEMLTKQAAEVARVATPEDAVHAISSYVASTTLPPRLRIGADLSLAALPWKAAWDISRVYGRAEPSDKACLSRAIVAAAETGPLFLVSGADNPTTLNFLPEFHMVLVKASDIVGSYEEAWDRLRKIYG